MCSTCPQTVLPLSLEIATKAALRASEVSTSESDLRSACLALEELRDPLRDTGWRAQGCTRKTLELNKTIRGATPQLPTSTRLSSKYHHRLVQPVVSPIQEIPHKNPGLWERLAQLPVLHWESDVHEVNKEGRLKQPQSSTCQAAQIPGRGRHGFAPCARQTPEAASIALDLALPGQGCAWQSSQQM